MRVWSCLFMSGFSLLFLLTYIVNFLTVQVSVPQAIE